MASLERALGRVIAEERQRRGISQEVLAHKAKLHATYISQLERGLKSPTLRALAAICKGLDIEMSEAIRKAESNSGPTGR